MLVKLRADPLEYGFHCGACSEYHGTIVFLDDGFVVIRSEPYHHALSALIEVAIGFQDIPDVLDKEALSVDYHEIFDAWRDAGFLDPDPERIYH